MRRILSLPVLLALVLLIVFPAAAAHTVTVWSGDMDGWAIRTSDDGTPPNTANVTFVPGPATPPLGTGSAQLSVGTNGASGAELRQSDYAGTPLAALTELSYWTYIATPGSGGQAPYIILAVDLDGDGGWDDLLFFEPVYQDGSYAGDAVPDQGSVTTGTWQQWDARAGGWWSLNAGTFGPPLVTLETYVAANPTATLVNQSAGGGIRFVAGFGAGAWDNFIGNIDAVVIGTSHTTTYDFEVAGLATPTPTPTPAPTPTPEPDADPSVAATPTADEETPAPTTGLLPDTATNNGQLTATLLVLAAVSALVAAAAWVRLRGSA